MHAFLVKDLYTFIKITEINRRKEKTNWGNSLEGEFKGKRLRPSLIVINQIIHYLRFTKNGKEKAFIHGHLNQFFNKKPDNFTNDMNSVDVNEITPKLIKN